MLSFREFHDTYQDVSMSSLGDAEAYLNIEDHRIVYVPSSFASDQAEIDEAREQLDSGQWIAFPDKYELELGRDLALRFAYQNLSEKDADRVWRFFSREGAYGRFKQLLIRRGLLERWYEFENAEEVKALKEWLTENDIEFVDDEPKFIP